MLALALILATSVSVGANRFDHMLKTQGYDTRQVEFKPEPSLMEKQKSCFGKEQSCLIIMEGLKWK